MLSNLLRFVKTKGSSFALLAHGWVGARATSFLAAHFALQNTLSKSAEKKASPSEGEAEGGCGGNSASPEPKRSPTALLGQSSAPQKSFLFLLEEKEIALQIKKCEENFFAGWRASASGGAEHQNSAFGFSLKKVRISFSVRSHSTHFVRSWSPAREEWKELNVLGEGIYDRVERQFNKK